MRIIMKEMHPLRSYRALHGLSCAELAIKLGIAEPTLRSFENGNRAVSAEMAVKIESALGIARVTIRPDIFGPAHQSQEQEAA